jgi:hypothetical protein
MKRRPDRRFAWRRALRLNSRPGVGPLRVYAAGALLLSLTDCVACRVPPRQAGNFHLRGQMKVTKAKALNATPFMRSARFGTPTQRATWNHCCTSNLQRARRRGPRSASPAQIRWTPGQSAARPRRASCRFDWRRCGQVARRAGCARREERAERFCIQPLCFGDFHLRPQMKATRLPGRDPASNEARRTSPRQDSDKPFKDHTARWSH